MCPSKQSIRKCPYMSIRNFYTDGACRRNPGGRGAYGFIEVSGNSVLHSHVQVIESTTNNRMEILGIYSALQYLSDRPSDCEIFSDSQYAIKSCTGKWRGSSNRDLLDPCVRLFKELSQKFLIKTTFVRGHSGNKWNDEIDHQLNQALQYNQVSCRRGNISIVPWTELDWDKFPELKFKEFSCVDGVGHFLVDIKRSIFMSRILATDQRIENFWTKYEEELRRMMDTDPQVGERIEMILSQLRDGKDVVFYSHGLPRSRAEVLKSLCLDLLESAS